MYLTGVSGLMLDGFVNAGYDVAIVARTKSKLDEAAAPFVSDGKKVYGFSADFSKPESLKALIGEIFDKMGKIDVCIYNAAIGHVDYEASAADFSSAANVNVISMHALLSAVLPSWKAAGKGVFLITGGGYALDGKLISTVYPSNL